MTRTRSAVPVFMAAGLLTSVSSCAGADRPRQGDAHKSPSKAPPLRICMVSGSLEYKSDASLKSYKDYLEKRYDVRCTLLRRRAKDELPGLEALEDCDVAILFTRRMTIDGEDLARIKRYCLSGRPIVGVRTASHGFQKWLALDREVLGGNYKGHYGSGPMCTIAIDPKAKAHPILAGFKPYVSVGSLYRNTGLAKDTTVLLTGAIPGHTEPIAWTRIYKGGRVFYTSLGHPEDFKNEGFRRMITNALFWVTKREPPKPLAPASQADAKPKVTIVRPDQAPWLVRHAADELAKYVRQMTAGDVTVAKDTPEPTQGQTVMVLSVGPAADRLKSLPGADDPRRLRDGFVIRSLAHGHLQIAATQPIGLLYGVYEYLETCCGVGFFWDGDYVPKRTRLPVRGIEIAELPRWPVRHFGLSSCWGLAKWHHQFRTMAHRRQIFDWMAKRKINRTHHFFGPTIAASGQPVVDVYGISDTQPDNFTFAGWPGCLGWPAKVRTRIIKEQLDYARQRGMTWIYYLAYGNLPHQFRQMHPEYKYVGQLGYSATVLYPDDPQAARWSKAFYQAIIETYGTDHIYQDCPFVESAGAADAEKSFQLKLTAAREMCKVYKALDGQAIWESDAWDFGALPHVWTAERIKRYFKSLPQEMMLIYDTAGLGNPFYKRTNYFEGTPWALGILHSFQGDDHLHGDLNHAIGGIQALSKDPKAGKCEGIYHVPESSGHNALFFDLTCHLAWRPDGLTLAGYLRDYTKRRFGEKDLPRMLPATQALVRAVYSGGRGGGVMPIYQKLGCHYGPREWWPIVDDRKVDNDGYDNIAKVIPYLRQAIRLGLACRDTQQGNPLYVNDMVDWTRTYLAHLFNWAVLDAYRGLKQGNAERVKTSVATARRCLKHVEAILSSRPDFSLQAQIDRAMKVPGTNPYLPWYMKQHCVNDLYSSNEVYEQLHWYYGPRMAVYLTELEARAAKQVKTITWKDVEARCGAIHARWLDKDVAVPAGERFKGTTMAAVTAAFKTRVHPDLRADR